MTTRRKSSEEFRMEIAELTKGEYVIIGDYTNNKTKIETEHVTCGSVFFITPHNLLLCYKARKGGCMICGRNRTASARRGSKLEEEARIKQALGANYRLLGGYVNSRTKLEIRHLVCGSVFTATPNNLLCKESRCPCQKKSKGEARIEEHLLSLSEEFTREYRDKKCRATNTLPFDFAVFRSGSLALLIEFDGEQHYEVNDFFGGTAAFASRKRNDKIKTDFCRINGIPLLRIPYWSIDSIPELIDQTLLDIMAIPSEAC
ncbi:DUF2726 domain-containing protein [Paenibacillus xylanexedens]|uniref:DUF2726 domain-containing protein n=1 Tax=Paenibacillus xylanexedens TaxID=528191 RepID=UPI00119ED54E|nr:DUF2726 domain-containing protein [Paenibacillus xylanexedens]